MENFIKCPSCDGLLDGTFEVGPNNRLPKKDDISICAHCGTILQFNEDLTYRKIDEDVWDKIKDKNGDTYRMIIESVIAIKSKSMSLSEIYTYLKTI